MNVAIDFLVNTMHRIDTFVLELHDQEIQRISLVVYQYRVPFAKSKNMASNSSSSSLYNTNCDEIALSRAGPGIIESCAPSRNSAGT